MDNVYFVSILQVKCVSICIHDEGKSSLGKVFSFQSLKNAEILLLLLWEKKHWSETLIWGCSIKCFLINNKYSNFCSSFFNFTTKIITGKEILRAGAWGLRRLKMSLASVLMQEKDDTSSSHRSSPSLCSWKMLYIILSLHFEKCYKNGLLDDCQMYYENVLI